MPNWEYLVKGTISAKLLNPWPVNKERIFENLTEELNKMAEEGWELIAVIPAGNLDRQICYFRREKK